MEINTEKFLGRVTEGKFADTKGNDNELTEYMTASERIKLVVMSKSEMDLWRKMRKAGIQVTLSDICEDGPLHSLWHTCCALLKKKIYTAEG